ncbi:hypothetical protein FB559_1162 [Actinoallomurus bryophytorum]|uniref:Uncharacterized protein n=1 Tax=Actinoallomurus bryophytorum TaxID=1490222 RepID=A0A543CEX5_9ACTN|nr:hypothetical protein FB559_1162 [Actinoallomurus bryophytorum]
MRFAVHRPAQRSASPRGHGTSCRDVLGCVHIRVIGTRAGATAKNRLALTVSRVAVPAGVTDLGRERGIDLLHPPRRLVPRPGHEQAPAGRVNGPVRPGLGPHIPTWRVDGAAPITLTGLRPADRGLHALLAVRPASRPSRPAPQPQPQPQQTLALGLPQARGGQHLAGRQRGRDGHTTIHPHDLTRTRAVHRRRDRCERDMPAPRSISGHPERFCLSRDGAGPAEPHPAHLRDPHLTRPARQTACVPLSATAADDPKTLTPTGFTPRRTSVRSSKEISHGLGEVSQRLLPHRLGSRRQSPELSSGFGQQRERRFSPGLKAGGFHAVQPLTSVTKRRQAGTRDG